MCNIQNSQKTAECTNVRELVKEMVCGRRTRGRDAERREEMESEIDGGGVRERESATENKNGNETVASKQTHTIWPGHNHV